MKDLCDPKEIEYVLGYDGETFWTINREGTFVSPFQSVEECDLWVSEGTWVEIKDNPFE
jgi:hypothetical protein